jgi:biopolymer transport protein ExbD
MAISVPSGGARPGRRAPLAAMSEINVIPLVDVVLVMLIIFMLTAHVMEFGLEVEVPKVRETRTTTQELPVVTISREGAMQLNDQPVRLAELAAQVRQRFPEHRAVYVRADKATVYDVIAQVISELGRAKLGVLMVTQTADSSP